tara:strand:+ start:1255 stop:2085 length:831 start_codon:yes stop_codon:yes gene_type:complete
MGIDWEQRVLSLREMAAELREKHPDAALMKCRKAMEAIQLSIFVEKFGEEPSGYIPFEQMMKKEKIGAEIPKPHAIEFSTIQQWGNYGSHFQADEPSPNQVDLALGCLDNLIAWRFTTKQEKENLRGEIKKYLQNAKGSENINFKIIELTKSFDKFDKKWKLIDGDLKMNKSFIDLYINSINNDDVRIIKRAIDLVSDPKTGWARIRAVLDMAYEIEPSWLGATNIWKFSDLIKKYPQYFVWEEGKGDISMNALIVTRVKNRDTIGSFDPTIAAAV